MKQLPLSILIISTIALSACQTNGTNPMKGMFGANILVEESNSAQAIVHDAGGMPGATQKEANKHCSNYNKIAVYSGTKTGFNCWHVPCQVYRCVKEEY